MTHITESVLYKKYKVLFNFLGAWFADMDFENLTEETIVKEYKKVSQQITIYKTIQEAKQVKGKIKNHWEAISKATNIYFKNEKEALSWLNKIIAFLEDDSV